MYSVRRLTRQTWDRTFNPNASLLTVQFLSATRCAVENFLQVGSALSQLKP